MFSEPPRTQYDWNFKVLGLPVRVHPLFWVIIILLGMPSDTSDMKRWLQQILCWVASAFFVILLHELGHALILSRVFGARTWIVFYGMGGLTAHDYHYRKRTPNALGEILISIMGPVSGFLLAGFILGLLLALGMNVQFHLVQFANFIPFPLIVIDPESFARTLPFLSKTLLVLLYLLINDMIYISVFWGLLNLLPIYPLDGGHIAREMFCLFNRKTGILNSLWLSTFFSGAIAVISLTQWIQQEKMVGFPWITMLFGYLAYQSAQLAGMYRR
ncbi:MAG: site-2 protease family protein [Thermoguttaceae bacterium]